MEKKPMEPQRKALEKGPETGRKAKKNVPRRLIKLFAVLTGSLLLLIALLLGAVALILTPSRLTPLVNEYSSRYLDAQVRFDTVTLSVFENFPNVSVKLSGGEIISHAFAGLPDSLRTRIPAAADTLLKFDEFSVSLNLPQLLASRISIRRIALTRPRVYAYVSPWGKANWEIFAADTTAGDSTEQGGDLYLNIAGLDIRNSGRIVYDSKPDKLYATVDLEHLRLKNTFRHDYKIDLSSVNSVRLDTLDACGSLPVALKGGFTFNPKHPETIALDKLNLQLGDIPIGFDGRMSIARDSIVSELQCTIRPLALERAITLVPPQLMPMLRAFDTNLAFDLHTRIDGSYRFSDGRLPRIDLDVTTNDGYLSYKNAKARIDRFGIDASLRYDPQRPDSTGAVFRKLDIAGSGIRLHGSGSVWNAMRDPAVRMKLTGAVYLDTLSILFPSKQDIAVRGRLGLNTDASFRISQLQIGKIGKTRVEGTITLDSLLVDIPRDTIFMMVGGGMIHFGSDRNRQDSLIGKDAEMLHTTVKADTLNLRMKRQWVLLGSAVSASAHSAASTLSGDTTVVHPLNGRVEARMLAMAAFDSTWIRLDGMQSNFSIVPSEKNPAVPLLQLGFDARAMQAKSAVNRYDLQNGHVDFRATLVPNRMDSARRRQLLDSLQQAYPSVARDSLFAYHRSRTQMRSRSRKDDFSGSDLDLSLDKSAAEMLRRWDASGSVKAASGRLLTPYFPLTNTLQNVDIAFTTDAVKLKNTQIQSGQSSLELTGEISNLRRVLLGRGQLKIKMNIESDTLNFNELIHAATVGAQYENASETYQRSVAEAENSEQLQQVIAEQSGVDDTTAASPLIVIPSNVDAQIDLCTHYGIYTNLRLNSLAAELIARDRCLQIKDMKAETDAGSMNLTALYATRSRDDIITGFDLELTRMKVDRLISLIPEVDSMLPMLRSFEGVVDCQIAATAAVDTMMNIDLSTLNAACSIHGENMVLLDGETFTEIAKMMHFKNKQRNLIDRISVNMLVRNNQIELFPFIIEMDRYKAAVSGVQKLDMSFNYHISVLKSPIPFRLGINIFGTLDKFKFRLGRARYRSENIPSYVGLIDTTRVNLRHTITDIFHKGIEAASLSGMKITPAAASLTVNTDSEALSKADSLELQSQGILGKRNRQHGCSTKTGHGRFGNDTADDNSRRNENVRTERTARPTETTKAGTQKSENEQLKKQRYGKNFLLTRLVLPGRSVRLRKRKKTDYGIQKFPNDRSSQYPGQPGRPGRIHRQKLLAEFRFHGYLADQQTGNNGTGFCRLRPHHRTHERRNRRRINQNHAVESGSGYGNVRPFFRPIREIPL